ncbi:site-specific integrase [Variovorax sp. LjRoot130]
MTLRKESECHSANAAVSGGSTSSLPTGSEYARTSGTANKALAQEFHDRIKSELWRIAKLGERPRRTWNEAAVRWLKEQSHKATAKEDRAKLRWLDPHLGGRELDTINRALIDAITDAKLAGGCSNATVNRVLALVRSILRKCVRDWEWLDKAPAVRMLREPKRRIRYLTRQEAQRLLAELPEHLADMATFSLSTGLRAANVTGLMWSQVDLDRRLAWIHPDQAKARKAIRFRSTRKRSQWSPSSWGNTPRTCSAIRAAGSRRSVRRRGIRR